MTLALKVSWAIRCTKVNLETNILETCSASPGKCWGVI